MSETMPEPEFIMPEQQEGRNFAAELASEIRTIDLQPNKAFTAEYVNEFLSRKPGLKEEWEAIVDEFSKIEAGPEREPILERAKAFLDRVGIQYSLIPKENRTDATGEIMRATANRLYENNG